MDYSKMGIYEMAEKHNELQRGIPYPSKPQKPNRDAYKSNEAFGKAMDAWELDVDNWRVAVDEYRAACDRIYQSFKTELLKALGIADHPKAQKLWQIAWDSGHSNGYYEVAQEAETLAELLN